MGTHRGQARVGLGVFNSGNSGSPFESGFQQNKQEIRTWGQVLVLSAKLSVESEASRKSGLVIWPKSV